MFTTSFLGASGLSHPSTGAVGDSASNVSTTLMLLHGRCDVMTRAWHSHTDIGPCMIIGRLSSTRVRVAGVTLTSQTKTVIWAASRESR